MSNTDDESHTNIPDELLASSLPTHIAPYRCLSAKRPRDPLHRKSVSFNDVPIVHEVPSHDTTRNSTNYDVYRSWTYTDATSPISLISPFSSSQILSPFNSTSAAVQKLHANRLSNALYSSTNSTTLNRSFDSNIRTKTNKTTEEITEHNTSWNPPLIVVHTPDERINKNSSLNQSISSENGEERKHRSPTIPDTIHYRSLPFTYVPLSESTTTYTSMLSTNIIPSNNSSNEQSSIGHTRTIRARSATLPTTANLSSTRNNDNVSITPFRTTTSTSSLSNGLSSRTVLKPTTIAFQCSQPTTTTNNASSTLVTTNTSTSKSPTVPSRLNSYIPQSRSVSFSNRPLSSSIKYSFAHTTTDSIPKPPSTTLTRSRSAHLLNTRRHTTSPFVMLDGQSGGTNNTNLYSTTKRNPNIRQTYSSYSMHRVLLPANIN